MQKMSKDKFCTQLSDLNEKVLAALKTIRGLSITGLKFPNIPAPPDTDAREAEAITNLTYLKDRIIESGNVIAKAKRTNKTVKQAKPRAYQQLTAYQQNYKKILEIDTVTDPQVKQSIQALLSSLELILTPPVQKPVRRPSPKPASVPVPDPTPSVVAPAVPEELKNFVKLINDISKEFKKVDKGLTEEFKTDFSKSAEAFTAMDAALIALQTDIIEIQKNAAQLKKLKHADLNKLLTELKKQKTQFETDGTKPIELLNASSLDKQQATMLASLDTLTTKLEDLSKKTAPKPPAPFKLTVFGSEKPTATPELKLQLAEAKVNPDQFKDIKEGIVRYAGRIAMEIIYDEKQGLQMQLPGKEKFPAGTTAEQIQREKMNATIKLICTMFVNSAKGGSLIISGGNHALVALAKVTAEQLNSYLPADQKRKIEVVKEITLKPEDEETARINFKELAQGNFQNKEFWEQTVSQLTEKQRDADIKKMLSR